MQELVNVDSQRKAMRFRNAILYPSRSHRELEERAVASANLALGLNHRFKITDTDTNTSSSIYFLKYVNLVAKCEAIKLGLIEFENSFENFYLSYKRSLLSFSASEDFLKKLRFENLKKRKTTYKLYKRINSFKNSNIDSLNDFKHPNIIDYYFSRESFCSVKNDLITLPLFNERNLKIKDIRLDINKSNNFKTNDPLSNLKTEATSCQQILKSESFLTSGSSLCYIFEFSKKSSFNKIEIIDSSINEASVAEMFFYKNQQKITLSFVKIKKLNKSIFLLNDSYLAKRIYIVFNQFDYVEKSVDEDLSVDSIVLNTPLGSLELVSNKKEYYWYEINIDKVSFKHENFKQTGFIKIDEKIDVADLSRVMIDLKGFNISGNVELYLEREKLFNEKVTSTTTKENLNEIIKIQDCLYLSVYLVLNSNSEIVRISSIDIKGA